MNIHVYDKSIIIEGTSGDQISIDEYNGVLDIAPIEGTSRSINTHSFSGRSKTRLVSCDRKIQVVFETVIQTIDCTILCGHRTQDEQNEAFHTGHSQLRWPKSKHNSVPSQAIDAIPYPIDWKDRERLTLFAGFVLGIGARMGITLRWGGDWNRNWNVQDNSFDDLVHFELV